MKYETDIDLLSDLTDTGNKIYCIAGVKYTADLLLVSEWNRINPYNKAKELSLVKLKGGSVSFDDVVDRVCAEFKLQRKDFFKNINKRLPRYVTPRQVISFISLNYLGLSSIAIAESISKDHATVLHSESVVLDFIETDSMFLGKIKLCVSGMVLRESSRPIRKERKAAFDLLG